MAWEKVGRGHTFQFFITDEELLRILTTTLPKKFAPYILVGVDISKPDKTYNRTPFVSDINNILTLVKTRRGNNMYLIASTKLTPELNSGLEKLSGTGILKGLISLHHGTQREVRRKETNKVVVYDTSSISIIDKIYNPLTGETMVHEEYYKIYLRLKRAIRKILIYTSVAHSRNGAISENNFQMMSEGAANLVRKGHPFINSLGTKLTKTL